MLPDSIPIVLWFAVEFRAAVRRHRTIGERCSTCRWHSAPAVGKTFGWCILVLTFTTSYEVFARYLFRRADRMGVRRQLHALRHAVHAGRRLYAVAQRPCARRFPLSRLVAAHAGREWIWCSISCSSFPGMLAFIYSGYGFAKLSWHDERAFVGQPDRADRLAVQVADPDRRRADGAAGHRRSDPLHHLHPRPANGRKRLHDVEELDKIMLEKAEQGEYARGRRSSRKSACGRGTSDVRHRQSRTRRADARPVRRLHHVRLSDRLHADGARRVLRLLRDGRPDLLAARPAHLFGDDERRADLDPVVRVHGLRHRARQHPRPAVPFAAARRRSDARRRSRSRRSPPARSSPPPPASSAPW